VFGRKRGRELVNTAWRASPKGQPETLIIGYIKHLPFCGLIRIYLSKLVWGKQEWPLPLNQGAMDRFIGVYFL
jgi:hypothetical protein